MSQRNPLELGKRAFNHPLPPSQPKHSLQLLHPARGAVPALGVIQNQGLLH